MLEKAVVFIENVTGVAAGHQYKILLSLMVLAALWVLRRVLKRYVSRKLQDQKSIFLWRRTISYITVITGLIIILRIWFSGLSGLATFLGLASAGIAIALKEIIVNIAGWFYIIFRKPFVLGDRIEVSGVRGDVADVRVLGFSLVEVGNWVNADQSTGRIIHVPNGRVFSDSIANYTSGTRHIWEEVPVLITFESDWRRAKKIIGEAVNEVVKDSAEITGVQSGDRNRFLIYQGVTTPIVYTSVKESGVLLTARFPVEPRNRRGSVEELWENILVRFAQHDDIDFAYPTTRFYRPE